MSEFQSTTLLRRIKSFVRREGRITASQSRALIELFPKYGIDYQTELIDFREIYQRKTQCYLDIGFGNGNSLIHLGNQNIDFNYLGVEVHRPGVGNVLLQIEKNDNSNIRVICYDVVDVLMNMIPDNSLFGIFLLFPDPWHKRKHHKRRLLQEAFVQLLRKKLVVDGFIHMATDWQHYAEQMMNVMSCAEGFSNKMPAQQYSEKPEYRVTTKFERRGEGLGHGVWDLIFYKRS